MRNAFGFTMAEILLSLTIIGVVAAITLPSLTGDVNEKAWNTQKKALYSRFSQALALMPQLNGYGSYNGSNAGSEGSYSVSVTTDTTAEAFLTEGLSKVIKINNICDATHLADCGIPTSYTDMKGVRKAFPTKLSELNIMFTSKHQTSQNPQNDIDTKAAAFETQNGESIAVFYNPQCEDNYNEVEYFSQPKMCANFIYDLNGNKGPNTFGKDIGFITALYANNPVIVAPQPLATDAGTSIAHTAASAACVAQDADSKLPNNAELAAMFYNRELIGLNSSTYYWSSMLNSSTGAWKMFCKTGYIWPSTLNSSHVVRCIKR